MREIQCMAEVEEVRGRAAMRRFVELPFLIFREETRWAAPLVAVEKARFDRFSNKRLQEVDHVFLLARHLGTPSGRMALEVDELGQGVVTAYDVGPEPALAEALVSEARSWFAERAAKSVRGPEVLVDGFDVPGATGRPWHPRWYSEGLFASGFEVLEQRPAWRLPATGVPSLPPDPGADRPPVAGRFADRRLLLAGIAAVPDLTQAQRSVRELSRRAKRGEWSTAVVLACDGDPSVLVPALQAAAASAGYRDLIAPWSPDPDAPPETVIGVFGTRTADG